jgi:plastocyanin
MRRMRFVLVAALAALALVAVGCGGDDDEATDDTTVTETTETDTTVTETTEPAQAGGAPGSYELELEDLSSAHNFHLSGPGVDISTDVAEEGTQNLSLTVATGSYSFVCDPHSFSMSGSFEVAG